MSRNVTFYELGSLGQYENKFSPRPSLPSIRSAMGNNKKIILGSQSSGRKKVLEAMGYEFDTIPANIDEKAIRFDDATVLTLALANAKADALLSRIKEPAILITSDQVVVCDGKILEKPESELEAREYFKMYEKYPAETVTSVVVTDTITGKRFEGTDIAKIFFNPIPENIVSEYIATGDPFYNAGGFTHEHPLLSDYINRIEGESESITGLPKKLTEKLLGQVI